MSTRTLVVIVVAATVSATATSAVLQMALGSSASAKAGGSSGNVTHQISQNVAAELSVDQQILAQLKTFRKHTESSLAKLNTSTAKVNQHTANIDKSTGDALVPLNSIAKDNVLLVESYPDPNHYAVSLPQNGGLIPRTLDVLDHFCSDAQITQYGNGSDPGTVIGC
jgi:TolA-binding protein